MIGRSLSSATVAAPAKLLRRGARQRWRYAYYHGRGFIRGVSVDFLPFSSVRKILRRDNFAADTRAGLNVGMLAFPQSIAYSLIAGLPAQCGLISASVGAIVGGIFSKSRFIVNGPTNATAILILGGLATTGLSESGRVAALPVLVLLAGIFQILGSMLKIEQWLAYVSRTVVTGYITAAAALIVSNQLQNLLGVRVTDESTFFGTLLGTIKLLNQARWSEILMSVAALLISLGMKRLWPRLPNVAVTLVLCTVLAWVFRNLGWDLTYLAGFSIQNITTPSPRFDLDLVATLAQPALALAFVAILEGTSVGRTLAARSGERLHVAQEVYAMGVANTASALCGGMDASGSLTRSALASNSRARTAAATVLSGGVVLLLMLALSPLISLIPRAALAMLVVCIGISLFNRHHIVTALRTTRSDTIVFLVTVISALLFKLDTAIYLGAFVSLFLFLRKAGTPELAEYHFNQEGQLAEMTRGQTRATPSISILHAEGDLFFGSTELFIAQTREIINDPNLRIVILRLKNARHLDATVVLAIEELMDFLRAGQRHLLVSGADREIERVFRNSGLLERLGRENFFPELPSNPTIATRQALHRARQLLGQTSADIRIFVDTQRAAGAHAG
jgi:SulP family sulfate permease